MTAVFRGFLFALSRTCLLTGEVALLLYIAHERFAVVPWRSNDEIA